MLHARQMPLDIAGRGWKARGQARVDNNLQQTFSFSTVKVLCHCTKVLRTVQDLLGKENQSSDITDAVQCNDFHNLTEDSIINN